MIWFLIGWACLSFAFHKKFNEDAIVSILGGLLGCIAIVGFACLIIAIYMTVGWY